MDLFVQKRAMLSGYSTFDEYFEDPLIIIGMGRKNCEKVEVNSRFLHRRSYIKSGLNRPAFSLGEVKSAVNIFCTYRSKLILLPIAVICRESTTADLCTAYLDYNSMNGKD